MGRREPTDLPSGAAVPARRADALKLALLVAIVCGVGFQWIRTNEAPMQQPADPYSYLRLALEFANHVSWQGVRELAATLEWRPPLYPLLTTPFLVVFGRTLEAALFVNTVFHAILLLCTYGIARRVMNARAGLLAAVLVASYAPVVHMSRIYRPHSALPACVALSVFLLVVLVGNRSRKTAWLLGASLAFGGLMHPYFLWMMGAPTAVAGTALLLTGPPRPGEPSHGLLDRLRDPFVTGGLLPAALIALLPIGVWYLSRGAPMFSLAGLLGERASVVGVGYPDVPPSFWWYARTAPAALSSVLAAGGLLGVALCAAKRSLPVWVLLVTLLAGYASLSQWTHGWRIFNPLLPVLAAVTAIGITGIRTRWLSLGLTAVCTAAAIFNLSLLTWELPAWSRPVARVLAAPLDEFACQTESRSLALCPSPPRTEPWLVDEIFRLILADEECARDGACRLAIKPHRRLHPSYFQFRLIQDRPDAALEVVCWRDPTLRRSLCPESDQRNDYVLFLTADPSPDATRAFLRRLGSGFAAAHQEVARVAFPEEITATLFRRGAP